MTTAANPDIQQLSTSSFGSESEANNPSITLLSNPLNLVRITFIVKLKLLDIWLLTNNKINYKSFLEQF